MVQKILLSAILVHLQLFYPNFLFAEFSETQENDRNSRVTKLFQDQPSAERLIRFIPVYDESDRLSDIFLQICKGNPLICIGYVETWNRTISNSRGQHLEGDAEIIEKELHRGKKYLLKPDREHLDQKDLAFKRIAANIIDTGAEFDPERFTAVFEPEVVNDLTKNLAGQSSVSDVGGVIEDASYYLREGFRENGFSGIVWIDNLIKRNELAYQIMKAHDYAHQQIIDKRGKWFASETTMPIPLIKVHELREAIRPSVTFLRALRAEHTNPDGSLKDSNGLYAEVSDSLMKYGGRGPGGTIIMLDNGLDRFERIVLATNPGLKAMLKDRLPVIAIEFGNMKRPTSPKSEPVKVEVFVYGQYGKKVPLNKENIAQALENFRSTPEVIDVVKRVVSELKNPPQEPIAIGSDHSTVIDGQEFKFRDHDIFRLIYPELQEGDITFARVDKALRNRGLYDALHYKLTATSLKGGNESSFNLDIEIISGDQKHVLYDREVKIKPNNSGGVDICIPWDYISMILLKAGESKKYSKLYQEYSDQRREAVYAKQEKEDTKLSNQIIELINELEVKK